MDSILIACPTYKNKEYILDEYLDAINKMDKNGFYVHLLLIDNTDDNGEYARILVRKLNQRKIFIPFNIYRFEADYLLHSRERVGISYAIIRNFCLGKIILIFF